MSTIVELIRDLDRAITDKDIDAIRWIYAEEAVFVAQPGRIANGREEIAAYYGIRRTGACY